MQATFPLKSALLALLGSATLLLGAAAPSLQLIPVAPKNESALYAPGDKIAWRVEFSGDAAQAQTTGSYTIKQAGAKLLARGTLTLGETQPPIIQASLDKPGTLLAEVSAPLASGTTLNAANGAAVEPWKLQPSAPTPADFDTFWKAKIAELSKIPVNPVLEPGESGDPAVKYWKTTFDNIRGTHIQGQLARPAKDGKFPAMLLVQYAGVYPLKPEWVLKPAAQGWLILNIEAHDIPIGQPKDFYANLSQTTLKNYSAIGNTDREKNYFLRMFLSCYRAADYLSHRPDWNGKILLVTGGSQGGLQSLVTAALHPKITALIAEVPAGCDDTGSLLGRTPGWPYWKNNAPKDPEGFAKAMETSKYFDGVNFAARVHCPALIGMGLSDVTSPASGVFTAFNQLQGPKEIVIMPPAPHQNKQNTHAPFYARAAAWKAALLLGQPAPVQPNPSMAALSH